MSDTRRLALELHEIRQLALGHATNPQFGNSSVDGEGLSFRDGDGNEIGRIGGGGNGMEVEYTYGPKPPMPSAPIVTADANLLRVQWDGQWADGNEDGDAAADPSLASQAGLDRVEVHASMEPTFVPDPILSFAGVLPVTPEGGTHTVGPLAEAGDYYVVLMARGKDGQYSAPSQRVHVVTTVGLMENELFDLALRADEARESADGKNTVHYGEEPEAPEGGFAEGDLWFDTTEDPETGFRTNMPHLWDPSANNGEGGWVSAADSRVDAIRDAQDALREDVERIVTDGAGATTYWLPTEPDETTDPPPKLGDIWFNTSDGNKLHRFDGQGWASASDSRFQTIQDAYDDLESDVDAVRTSVDGKNAITQSIDAPPSQYDGAVGDRWERMSSMGSGGSLISNWRWNGDVWVSTIISDAVLGNVDAAKIGTGYLDAERIEAGSITADKLMVGNTGNLLSNPSFANDGAGWSSSRRYSPTGGVDGMGILALSDLGATTGSYLGLGSDVKHAARVEPGRTYKVEVWVRSAVPITTENLRVYNRLYSADGSDWTWPEVGTSSRVDGPTTDVPVNEWFRVSKTFVAEEGWPRAAIGLYRTSHLTGGDIEWSAPSLRLAVGATLIEDGAITTDKIATGAITAESGIIASLDAGIINSGTVDAARLAAGSITADKLLVGGSQNLIPGVRAGSNRGMSEFVWDDTEAALRIDGRSTVYADESFFLGPGEYVVEADIKASVEGTRTYLGLLGLTPAWNYRYGISNVLVSTEWQHFSATLSIPEGDEGEVQARFLPAYTGDDTATTWYRNVTIRPMVGATLIENGAITTEKIAVGAITAESGIIGSLDAGVITTGELRGELIRAQSIAGESLAVDAIDGKTITGATIRTSSAGQRVEMNTDGLFVRNSFGIATVRLANGTIEADGGTITGGTIRTSASGARVQLDTGGLKAWNPSNEETFSVDANTGSVAMTGNLYSRPEPADSRVVIDNSIVMNRITGEDGTITQAHNAGLLIGTEAYSGVLYTRIPDGNPWSSTPAGTWLIGPDSRSSLNFSGGDGLVGLVLKTQKTKTGRQAVLTGSETDGLVTWETKTENRSDNEFYTRSIEESSDTFAQTFVQSRRRLASEGYATIATSLPAGSRGDIGVTAGDSVSLQAGGDVAAKTGGSRVEMQRSRIDFSAPTSLVFSTGGGGDLAFSRDSSGAFVRSRAVMNRTYSYAANMYVTTSGIISKSTSARRYKTDEQEIAPAEYADALLSIPFKSWLDKAQIEQHAELEQFREDNPMCPTPEYLAEAADGLDRHVGAVAEDFVDAGLSQFVTFDQYGRPDGLQYDRVGVALLPIVKGLQERIERLEERGGHTMSAQAMRRSPGLK